MTRFDDGYETVIHFPGSIGPAVALRSTAEAAGARSGGAPADPDRVPPP